MQHAKVIGWYGNSNVGDESYRVSFPLLFPDVAFEFMPVPNGACDNYILGGGNILNEGYVKTLLNAPAKRHMIMSVSADENTPFELLKKVDSIWVRDIVSQNLLERHGVACGLLPDACMALEASPKRGREWLAESFAREGLELYKNVVGVVLNGHLYHRSPDNLERDFIALMGVIHSISKLADDVPASFVFFAMCPQLPPDDRILGLMAAGKCKFWKKNLVITNKLGVQETLDMISACDVVVSTRLHSTLFSVVAGTPFVDIVHHDKNLNCLVTLGLEKWSLSYWSLAYKELRTMIEDRLEKQSQYRSELLKVRLHQKEMLLNGIKNVYFA